MDGAERRKKVCVLTGTRADYGLLKETLFRLREAEDIDLRLLVTGSHLSERFGNTQEEIRGDGFADYLAVPIPLEDDTERGMAHSMAAALDAFSDCLEREKPDLLVVLGDRYEALAAALAARLNRIPVAHISGGDVTEGALDDAFRHSITKMSTLHFPGCLQSAKRIVQMGESPNTVFEVGEPGVENCLKTRFLEREELAEDIGFSGILGVYSVVTFHPVTMEDNTGISQIEELMAAMESFPEMAYLITLANADRGGRAINDRWVQEAKERENWYVTPSLGVHRYLSALRSARLVLGNSSSGIVEAPALGIPTVNIGDRQKGRMISGSVLCCEPIREEIIKAMGMALSETFRDQNLEKPSPFGDGSTSRRIVEEIERFLRSGERTAEKHFYDIEFELPKRERGDIA